MLNYAFVNSASRLAYITDDTFVFRGTWSSAPTYSAPLDVVDYNNGKWIANVTNLNTAPLGSSSWAQLCLVGTVASASAFDLAAQALATANGAMSISVAANTSAMEAVEIADNAYSLAAIGTNVGTNALNAAAAAQSTANGAYSIAVAGTNLASSAYALASFGTQPFVASGPSHHSGAVPDPGATAGTLRYLREDATWANPSIRTVVTLIDAGTVIPNSDTTDIAYLSSLSQTTFIANPIGTPWDSKGLVFRIKSAAPQLLSFGTLYRGGLTMALPAATTGSSKTDYFAFIFNNGDTRWDFTGSVLGF